MNSLYIRLSSTVTCSVIVDNYVAAFFELDYNQRLLDYIYSKFVNVSLDEVVFIVSGTLSEKQFPECYTAFKIQAGETYYCNMPMADINPLIHLAKVLGVGSFRFVDNYYFIDSIKKHDSVIISPTPIGYCVYTYLNKLESVKYCHPAGLERTLREIHNKYGINTFINSDTYINQKYLNKVVNLDSFDYSNISAQLSAVMTVANAKNNPYVLDVSDIDYLKVKKESHFFDAPDTSNDQNDIQESKDSLGVPDVKIDVPIPEIKDEAIEIPDNKIETELIEDTRNDELLDMLGDIEINASEPQEFCEQEEAEDTICAPEPVGYSEIKESFEEDTEPEENSALEEESFEEGEEPKELEESPTLEEESEENSALDEELFDLSSELDELEEQEDNTEPESFSDDESEESLEETANSSEDDTDEDSGEANDSLVDDEVSVKTVPMFSDVIEEQELDFAMPDDTSEEDDEQDVSESEDEEDSLDSERPLEAIMPGKTLTSSDGESISSIKPEFMTENGEKYDPEADTRVCTDDNVSELELRARKRSESIAELAQRVNSAELPEVNQRDAKNHSEMLLTVFTVISVIVAILSIIITVWVKVTLPASVAAMEINYANLSKGVSTSNYLKSSKGGVEKNFTSVFKKAAEIESDSYCVIAINYYSDYSEIIYRMSFEEDLNEIKGKLEAEFNVDSASLGDAIEVGNKTKYIGKFKVL